MSLSSSLSPSCMASAFAYLSQYSAKVFRKYHILVTCGLWLPSLPNHKFTLDYSPWQVRSPHHVASTPSISTIAVAFAVSLTYLKRTIRIRYLFQEQSPFTETSHIFVQWLLQAKHLPMVFVTANSTMLTSEPITNLIHPLPSHSHSHLTHINPRAMGMGLIAVKRPHPSHLSLSVCSAPAPSRAWQPHRRSEGPKGWGIGAAGEETPQIRWSNLHTV